MSSDSLDSSGKARKGMLADLQMLAVSELCVDSDFCAYTFQEYYPLP